MKFSPRSRQLASVAHHAQRGYVLITLILFVALLAIALTALAPVIAQQVKRDREEELIHRGTQYSRAIKHYMKKFTRYPTRIEDLESTNNLRFLRRRYKDPVTGKDFKLLHMGEVQMSFSSGLAGAIPAGTLAAGAAAGGNALTGGATTAFGGSGVFGGGPNGNSGGNAGGLLGGAAGGALGGNSSNPLVGGSAGLTSDNNADNGSDAEPNQPKGSPGMPNPQSGFGQGVQQLPGFNQQGGANQVIGGGPIVGVVSVSKDKSIRSFNKKEHYNEWQFIYDPSTDRGGLLTTPNQPAPQGVQAGFAGGIAGAPGAQPASPFGIGGGQQNPPGGMTPTPQQSPYPQMPPDQSPQ